MITSNTEIYVIGIGFINPADVSVGDKVYTLNNMQVEIDTVKSNTSEFVFGKINKINSGTHNIETSNDTLHLYYSDVHGPKYLRFKDIPANTRDKRYSSKKFLPVLSVPHSRGCRQRTDVELEYVARMLAVGVRAYEYDSFKSIVRGCTGEDALVLIHLMEEWLSESPGAGYFDRASVKSRTHILYDLRVLDDLTLIAARAGYTSTKTIYRTGIYGLKVNYVSMPIPGSIPKAQKYLQTNFLGLMYNVDAGNKSILGRSLNRCFYLPCKSILNKEI